MIKLHFSTNRWISRYNEKVIETVPSFLFPIMRSIGAHPSRPGSPMVKVVPSTARKSTTMQQRTERAQGHKVIRTPSFIDIWGCGVRLDFLYDLWLMPRAPERLNVGTYRKTGHQEALLTFSFSVSVFLVVWVSGRTEGGQQRPGSAPSKQTPIYLCLSDNEKHRQTPTALRWGWNVKHIRANGF